MKRGTDRLFIEMVIWISKYFWTIIHADVLDKKLEVSDKNNMANEKKYWIK